MVNSHFIFFICLSLIELNKLILNGRNQIWSVNLHLYQWSSITTVVHIILLFKKVTLLTYWPPQIYRNLVVPMVLCINSVLWPFQTHISLYLILGLDQNIRKIWLDFLLALIPKEVEQLCIYWQYKYVFEYSIHISCISKNG